jgi:hypothetical protein
VKAHGLRTAMRSPVAKPALPHGINSTIVHGWPNLRHQMS